MVTNPYQPPQRALDNTNALQIQTLPAKAGVQWFLSALELFRRRPVTLIFFAVPVGLCFSMVMGLCPIFEFVYEFYDHRPLGEPHVFGVPREFAALEYRIRESSAWYFIIAFFKIGIFICSLLLPVMVMCVCSVCRIIDNEEFLTIKNIWNLTKKSLVFSLIYGFLLAFLFPFTLHFFIRIAVARLVIHDFISIGYIFLAASIPFLVIVFWSPFFLRAWKDLSIFRLVYYSLVAYLKNWKSFSVNGGLCIALTLILSVIIGVVLNFITDEMQLFFKPNLHDKLKTTAVIVVSLFIASGIMSSIMFANIYYSYKTIFADQNETSSTRCIAEGKSPHGSKLV
jgi:hypothetical protein